MKPSRIASRIAVLAVTLLSAVGYAQTGSDKLDVQALENKYWSAKDDDFSVVQNRAFQKAKKIFGTLHGGVSINDPYYSGTYTGLSTGYFFNESWGVELSYAKADFGKSRSFKEIIRIGGGPEANLAVSRLGVNAVWTPIYAKMSLFDKKIIHFDMGLTVGVAQMTYKNPYPTAPHPVLNEQSKTKSSIGYSIGLMQQFYFSERSAIRVDFLNTWSTQDTVAYSTSGAGAKTGTKNINDTSLMIGYSYFFGSGQQ